LAAEFAAARRGAGGENYRWKTLRACQYTPVREFFGPVIDAYRGLSLGAKVALIVGIALVTTAAGMAVIVRLPAEHFLSKAPSNTWWRRHRIIRWTVLVVKNAIGLVVVALGGVMSMPMVPGPGLVFLLLGLSLLDFPGKKKLERKLVQRPSVMRFLNDLRASFGKAPFVVEPD
jgi:hypothetical protein